MRGNPPGRPWTRTLLFYARWGATGALAWSLAALAAPWVLLWALWCAFQPARCFGHPERRP